MEELFKLEDVITVATKDEAKQYIGDKVYPADRISDLRSLVRNNKPVTLTGVSDDEDDPYMFFTDGGAYAFFLPMSKVNKAKREKTYRAFKSISEFEFTLDIKHGDVLDVCGKDWEEGERMELMYIGNSRRDGRNMVSLGNMCMDLTEWFEEYEYYDETTGQWIPFGVAEE